jgi:hypothetical protein
VKLVVGFSWIGSMVVAFFLRQYFNSQWNENSAKKSLDVKHQGVSQSPLALTSDIQGGSMPVAISVAFKSKLVEHSAKSPKEIVALVT